MAAFPGNRTTGGTDLAILAAFRLLVERAELIRLLALRDIQDRYAGSTLGMIWHLVQPLILMLILIIIFGHAYGRGAEADSNFVIYMIAGYVPWVMTSTALHSSISAIRMNAALVNQMSFPLAVLPVKTVVAQVPFLAVGLTVLLAYRLTGSVPFDKVGPSWLLLALPLLICMHLLLTIGLAWFCASIGTFFRDLEPIMSNLLMVNIFLLPIFFPPNSAPKLIAPIVAYNPFSLVVGAYQDVLVFGYLRNPLSILIFGCLALMVFAAGYSFFRRVKDGFGNVI